MFPALSVKTTEPVMSEDIIGCLIENLADVPESFVTQMRYDRTVKELNALRSSIETHGSSEGLMAFADYNHVLSNAVNNIPAFESFNDGVSYDSFSELTAALENLFDTFNKSKQAANIALDRIIAIRKTIRQVDDDIKRIDDHFSRLEAEEDNRFNEYMQKNPLKQDVAEYRASHVKIKDKLEQQNRQSVAHLIEEKNQLLSRIREYQTEHDNHMKQHKEEKKANDIRIKEGVEKRDKEYQEDIAKRKQELDEREQEHQRQREQYNQDFAAKQAARQKNTTTLIAVVIGIAVAIGVSILAYRAYKKWKNNKADHIATVMPHSVVVSQLQCLGQIATIFKALESLNLPKNENSWNSFENQVDTITAPLGVIGIHVVKNTINVSPLPETHRAKIETVGYNEGSLAEIVDTIERIDSVIESMKSIDTGKMYNQVMQSSGAERGYMERGHHLVDSVIHTTTVRMTKLMHHIKATVHNIEGFYTK